MKGRISAVSFVTAMLLCGCLPALGEEVYEAWVVRYDSPLNDRDEPVGIAADKDGNVFVIGNSWQGDNSNDIVIVGYTIDGAEAWTDMVDGSAHFHDNAVSVKVDSKGYVYATGELWLEPGDGPLDLNMVTIKYTNSGRIKWMKEYESQESDYNRVAGMVLDERDNIYVCGNTYKFSSGNDNLVTIKYSPSGRVNWIRNLDYGNGSGEFPTAIATDGNARICIAGQFTYPYPIYSIGCLALAYDLDGNLLWESIFDTSSSWIYYLSTAVIDDSSNSIFSGLVQYDNNQIDYFTIKYNVSGDTVWTRFYNGTADSNDHANGVVVDSGGNIYVTGVSRGVGTNDDCVTVKYSPTGEELWVQRFNGDLNAWDGGKAITLGPEGGIYVSGYTRTDTGEDFLTIKYSSSGEALWIKKFNGPDNLNEVVNAMTVDSDGNVFVTGRSLTFDTYQDFATVKYSPCVASSPKAGDADSDDTLSIADVVAIAKHLFNKSDCGSDSLCWLSGRLCRGDWNGDEKITLGDIIQAVNFVFDKPGDWEPVRSIGCCPYNWQ